MSGTEIYKPSRIMNSIQYICEQNVIRIWEDKILGGILPQIESGENIQRININT